jgi:hypothetical protein
VIKELQIAEFAVKLDALSFFLNPLCMFNTTAKYTWNQVGQANYDILYMVPSSTNWS